jgi:hypothetical protein
LPRPDIINNWKRTIDDWCNDDSLPILVRRSHGNRGHEVHGLEKPGRILVPSDNAPAHWALALGMLDSAPSIEAIRQHCTNRTIPVSDPRGLSKTALWRNTFLFNSLGLPPKDQRELVARWGSWSVRHIDNVALPKTGRIETLPEETLKASFCRLLDLSNMILVPKPWGPIAELKIFRELSRKRMKEHLNE